MKKIILKKQSVFRKKKLTLNALRRSGSWCRGSSLSFSSSSSSSSSSLLPLLLVSSWALPVPSPPAGLDSRSRSDLEGVPPEGGGGVFFRPIVQDAQRDAMSSVATPGTTPVKGFGTVAVAKSLMSAEPFRASGKNQYSSKNTLYFCTNFWLKREGFFFSCQFQSS